MNCIIIDDEPLAVDLVADFVSKIESLNLVTTFNNAIDAISFINQNKIDLIFLDIEMPQFSGIDFINSLEIRPLVIFTTAYSNYAVEGFDQGVVDYLVKPIPFHRFLKAIFRANQALNLSPKFVPNHNLISAGNIEDENNFMFVRAENENIKINYSDILYIEGLKDYVKIYLINTKYILTLMSLIKLENSLINKGFSRIHRSYIVNLIHIKSIQKNRVLVFDKRLPISDSYKPSFFKKINL